MIIYMLTLLNLKMFNNKNISKIKMKQMRRMYQKINYNNYMINLFKNKYKTNILLIRMIKL